MEAIHDAENANLLVFKPKPIISQENRKALQDVENKIRNASIAVKSKGLSNIVATKCVPSMRSKHNEISKIESKIFGDVPIAQGLALSALPNLTKLPSNVEDIDAEDKDNPQLASIYAKEIYSYLRELEVKYAIKQCHLSQQLEVTSRMRGILIDWLVQVQLRFHLLQETLFLTVSILDRYLQTVIVKTSDLQLVGVTAMLIAAKFEEIYLPDISDFVHITDNAYKNQDILDTEIKMLQALDFSLGKPLPIHFLRRISKAGDADANIHTLAKYFLELSMPEYEMAHCSPSLLAAASLYLSLKLLRQVSPWTETLEFYSGYSEDTLMPTVNSLCKAIVKSHTSKLQAVKVKYSSSKLYKISTIHHLKSATVIDLAK